MTLTLPPEPYTVIQVHDSYGLRTWIRGDRYWSPLGEAACLTPEELEQQITNFKVLAQPASRADVEIKLPPVEARFRAEIERDEAEAKLRRIRASLDAYLGRRQSIDDLAVSVGVILGESDRPSVS